jgi:site-specific DNA-methyltransferase (adenine-specific)
VSFATEKLTSATNMAFATTPTGNDTYPDMAHRQTHHAPSPLAALVPFVIDPFTPYIYNDNMLQGHLYYGDNLDVLRKHITDNTIDLIYLDPPFNSKADYNILFKEPTGEPSEAQVTAFEDTWHWTPATEHAYQELIETPTVPVLLKKTIAAFRDFLGVNDMMAYLTNMAIRLVELQRVLKPTGTLYLHCDPKASHYLKLILDATFGAKNFRNEIVWCYRGGGVPKHDFANKHDIIFRYSKTDQYPFYIDAVRVPYSDDVLQSLPSRYDKSYRTNKVYEGYRPNPQGKHPEDWWPIQPIMPSSKERLSYPTQKPERLLERILLASSKQGDLVLDPFCGCGTTVAVAQRLKRNWIGIDITHLAINVIKRRLKDAFNLEAYQDYKVTGEPTALADAQELAEHNHYQFQWWALSLINATPYGDKKKGADTGIDGYLYFMETPKDARKLIIQVKSGNVKAGDIRDLVGVMNREKAAGAIFITLQPPTQPMLTEAVAQGHYPAPTGKFPKIQIITIGQLLAGKRPMLPPLLISPYKRAERATEQVNQKSLDLE